MDNPDEYAGGAVDTSINGDGAVNGIDADSIMGQNLTKTKRRHYGPFGKLTAKLYKKKSGKTVTFQGAYTLDESGSVLITPVLLQAK